MTPSHKLHHKQTKILFHVTTFTLSDRIYPINVFLLELKVYCSPVRNFMGGQSSGNIRKKNRTPLNPGVGNAGHYLSTHEPGRPGA